MPNFIQKFNKKKSNLNCHNYKKPDYFVKNYRVSKLHKSKRSSIENNKKEFKWKVLNKAHTLEEPNS